MEKTSVLYDSEAQSEMYINRPEYSPDIIREIIQFWQNFNTGSEIEHNLDIIDVGCGTGQLTKLLMPYARSLLGTDNSATQIDQARNQSTTSPDLPRYEVACSSNIPASDNSIDLITAALCVHWFDLDKFYAEVDRCLRKNGVLAILTYGEGHFKLPGNENMEKELNNFINHDLFLGDNYFGPFFCEKGRWAWNLLPGLKILYPTRSIRNENLSIDFNVTLDRYCKYLRSTSLYVGWKRKFPKKKDIVDDALEKIKYYLGNPASGLDTELVINFRLSLIMCSKL